MFDLFKKKESQENRSAEQQPIKAEPKFKATGLKKEDRDTDFMYLAMKQQMLHGFKDKLYTKREIIQLGQVMKVDAENAFDWQEQV